MTIFTGQILFLMFRRPFFGHEILQMTSCMAQRCVIPVVMTLGPMGMVLALHGRGVFQLFGAERLLGFLVGTATFRELAPSLACMLMAAQSGSGAAAELAAMRARDEIDATWVMGVHPYKVHVIPRVLGLTIAAPLLTVIGAGASLLGGFFVAVIINGQDSGAFLDNLYTSLTLFDLYSGPIKALSFGLLIGVIATYSGYSATGSAVGVGEAVNRTVVYSITMCLPLNYFLSNALFGIVE